MNINVIKNLIINKLSNTSNPIFKNILTMANNNDVKGLENFARNLLREQKRDYDKEFNEFIKYFK